MNAGDWSEHLDLRENDLPEEVVREPGGDAPEPQPEDVEALATKLLLDDAAWLSDLLRLLGDRKQIVLYGPPGTGKTFVARELAKYLSRDGGMTQTVQFHPSYSYEKFIEGYRPILSDGEMVYVLEAGPLVDLAVKARANQDRTFVLLIDEINRGNLPKIFGELLYLLEYRSDSVRLMYRDADEPFELPPNLYLIGTMNTADRSIGAIDAALRRRFHFFGLFPDGRPIADTLEKWVAARAPDLAFLPSVVRRLNARLAAIDGQLRVGHSYFMREGMDEEMLQLVWEADILPYLEDQLFGREDVEATFELSRLRDEDEGEPDADAPAQGA
jgi:5-methylcytosine-specific restriction protein B